MYAHNDIIKEISSNIKDIVSDKGHVYLYGSRARGDANKDSDWDFLVLLDKPKIENSDHDSVGYAITSLGWDYGECFIPILYTKSEWDSFSFMPFYKNVERDKILIV